MMKRIFGIMLVLFCIAPLQIGLATGDPNDFQGGKDPALFSRMPGFHIANYQELEFNRFEFPVASAKTQPVEGRHVYIDYYANDGIKLPSGMQIIRNYINAAKNVGGKTVYEYEDGGTYYVTLKVVKGGAEAWAFIEGAGNGMYKVNVIEKQIMSQDVTANADSLANSINESGKASVYGIYFDTGKSVIKSQSEPALTQIVKLLKNDPKLKLYVVGHTDNAGAFDYNIKLSQARAAAVVSALTKSGIAAARLAPFGAGPTAPVASNKSEEGRAKNRRVELVAQ
jgi:OOP family OmpA-OmpF porin